MKISVMKKGGSGSYESFVFIDLKMILKYVLMTKKFNIPTNNHTEDNSVL